MNKAANIFITVLLIVLIILIAYLGAERMGVFDKQKEEDTIGKQVEEITPTTKPETSGEVSMIFGGDLLLSNEVLNAYDKNGGDVTNIMGRNLLKQFTEADIAMVNNEFPFSNRGNQAQDKQYTFRVNPERVSILKEMGIDIVTVANNHSLDFGEDALIDTLDTLDGASILHSGAGKNLEEAKKINYIEKKGKKVAFLCASRVIPVSTWNATSEKPGLFTTYDPSALCEKIKEAKQEADVVVVYVHWGVERNEMPEQYQRDMGKQYIDAGADLVIGSHSHCLQGMEVYKGKLITYSLGNFIFNGRTVDTGAVRATIGADNSIEVQFIPCSSKSYQTEISDDSNYKRIIDYYKGISYDVNMDSTGMVSIN